MNNKPFTILLVDDEEMILDVEICCLKKRVIMLLQRAVVKKLSIPLGRWVIVSILSFLI